MAEGTEPFTGLQGSPWQQARGDMYPLAPGVPKSARDAQHCLAVPGLTSEFADTAIGLQQVARETATGVGPWGIEACLAAGSLAPLCALVYVCAGQTVRSQPIARVTPAPLWGKGPSRSPLGDT